MSEYGKYQVGVLSVADYTATEVVGFCDVQEDFPFVRGPGVDYGQTLTEIQSESWWNGKKEVFHVGRVRDDADPHDKKLLWVEAGALPLKVSTVVTDGVNAVNGWATPEEDSSPAATLVSAQVTNAGTLASIHAHADYFVVGVLNPDLQGEDLPPALEPYDADVPMQSGHKADLRDFCVNTLALPAGGVDKWFEDNPEATPWDFANDFKEFIT